MTTTVRVDPFPIPSAVLADDPLPVVADGTAPPLLVNGEMPDEVAVGMSRGAVRNLFPYTMQSIYGRELEERVYDSVVLENAHLRARVLPELGGRVWSLDDLDRGVPLLHENSAVQFANLALRDAWFAGGIEWNIGTRGQSPHTASPLHAALVDADGVTSLRMWEHDRLRGVVYSVELWLPEDSRVLLARVGIRNPASEDVPMYWWTNAAVPQDASTRVLTPSTRAIATDEHGAVRRVDVTAEQLRPGRAELAADLFFDPVPGARPWTAAVDADGDGLALLSSGRLRGRKLFRWGESRGGRRWQEWLTPPAEDGTPRSYAEIQSGLARTQFEHLVLPAGEEWSWVEAYGNIRAVDADTAAGRVEELWPAASVAADLAWADARSGTAPGPLISTGSGWGRLEEERRRLAGEPPLAGRGTPFDEVGAGIRPWLELLATGGLPDADHRESGGSFVRGAAWEVLLEAAPRTWRTTAHLGVMAHARGDLERAAAWYAASFALAPNLLALRGRALLHLADGRERAAGEEYLSAVAHAGPRAVRSVVVEGASSLLAAGRPEDALRIVEAAPAWVRTVGRVRLLEALALHRTGRDDEAGRMLRSGIEVADLREGDDAVSDLWSEVFPSEEVPREYDFRVAG